MSILKMNPPKQTRMNPWAPGWGERMFQVVVDWGGGDIYLMNDLGGIVPVVIDSDRISGKTTSILFANDKPLGGRGGVEPPNKALMNQYLQRLIM